MLKLLGKQNCSQCEQSKRLLEKFNVKYEFIDLLAPENTHYIGELQITSAGKFLYDDETKEVVSVTEYLDRIRANSNG